MYHDTDINKTQAENKIILLRYIREDSMKNHVTFPFKKHGSQFDYLTMPMFPYLDNDMQL